MWKLLSVWVLLRTGGGGSADDTTATVDPDLPAEASQTEAPTEINFAPADTVINRASCEANGPCDASCDEALVEELFVPAGTCVVFDCSQNGNTVRVGGCNNS